MGGTTTEDACSAGTINMPAIDVANAQWQGPGGGTTNMDWSLSVSDATGNLSSSYTGTGNYTPFIAASTPASPAAGCYVTKLNSIALTHTAAFTPANPFCSTTITGEQKTFSVYPSPIVSITSGPVDVCEGSPATFIVTVSNSTYTCGSSTSNIGWTATFKKQLKESSGGTSNDATFTLSPSTSGGASVDQTYVGSGNGTTTFTTSNLTNDDYNVKLNTFVTSSPATCASSTSTPLNLQVRSFPIPTASMYSTDTAICQSGSIRTPIINVTNAVWNGPVAGTVNMNYSLSVTDGTGLLSTPLNGTGNTIYGAVGPTGGFSPSCFSLTLNSILLTSTAGALPNPPVSPSCTKTLNIVKNYTVNPEPIVALSPAGPSPGNQINLCQGTGSTFGFTVTNASACAVGQSWTFTKTETFEAAAVGSSAVASTVISTAVTTALTSQVGNQS